MWAAPQNLLDSNLAMDRDRLAYLAQLPRGESLITAALREDLPLTVSQLSYRFGLKDMLRPDQDITNVASLLYYFGVLTLQGANASW